MMRNLSRSALALLLLAGRLEADVYTPRPFNEILDTTFAGTWTPTAVAAIENRGHVMLIDAATRSRSLGIDDAASPSLVVRQVADLSNGNGTYGAVMRSMFQLLDENARVLSSEPLTGTFTLQPELFSYSSLDADSGSGAVTATSLMVRDRLSYYADEQSTVAYLAFTFTGGPSATKIRASSRHVKSGDTFSVDAAWSSNQWVVMTDNSVGLTSDESAATEFLVASALDLIDFALPEGSDFNPAATEWQTNTFAAYPTNPSNGEPLTFDYGAHAFTDDLLREVDPFYTAQLGDSDTATAAASSILDSIESTVLAEGGTLRYAKADYLAFRAGLLGQRFGAVDIQNAKLGERTVEAVYFTNAADDIGVHHPYMVIASYDGTPRPNFLIDVPRPPGDGTTGAYPDQTITRNAILEMRLQKIPLRDYGLVSSLAENDLSALGNLAEDEGQPQSEWNTYTYAGNASTGIAVDGVVVYPATNNTLLFATAVSEVTSTGAHVGRGMALHYHADGHAFNGNGINLYNLADYEGHSHPPLIAFAYDGIALFGRYETTYGTMDGAGVPLDEYGGHDHGDYGYHYHAFSESGVVFDGGPGPDDAGIGPYTEHFLLVGAWRGRINDIGGFAGFSREQFHQDAYARYVGAVGTVDESSEFGADPTSAYVSAGQSVTLGIDTSTAPGASFQWFRYRSGESEPTAIAGATGSTLTLAAVGASDMGFYYLRKTTATETSTTSVAAVTIAGGDSRLANLSTRGWVPAGGTLTPGFTVSGDGAKPLLIRAVGPTLTDFGLGGVLADPALQLVPFGGVEPSDQNDNWGNSADVAGLVATSGELGAFPLTEGSLDAAALVSAALPNTQGNHNYTVVIGAKDGAATGLALAEIYDAESADSGRRLINLSTRGYSGNGANALSPGFVIQGDGAKQVLIRVVGPSLTQFGVSGVIADPRLSVVPLGQTFSIGDNDNWGGGTALTAAFAEVGAFALADGSSADAAIILRLPPGGYTVQVEGADSAEGNVLVEVYDLDN